MKTIAFFAFLTFYGCNKVSENLAPKKVLLSDTEVLENQVANAPVVFTDSTIIASLISNLSNFKFTSDTILIYGNRKTCSISDSTKVLKRLSESELPYFNEVLDVGGLTTIYRVCPLDTFTIDDQLAVTIAVLAESFEDVYLLRIINNDIVDSSNLSYIVADGDDISCSYSVIKSRNTFLNTDFINGRWTMEIPETIVVEKIVTTEIKLHGNKITKKVLSESGRQEIMNW